MVIMVIMIVINTLFHEVSYLNENTSLTGVIFLSSVLLWDVSGFNAQAPYYFFHCNYGQSTSVNYILNTIICE